MSEKRHRLYPNEIPEVLQGLVLRLEKLLIEKKYEEQAKITFRILYRLIYAEKGGRPKYPPFTWRNAEAIVTMYKDAL
jgi:hypothetical protein